MYDVIVIGGGPAGLAAAIAADAEGASVLLIEREERLGGILKQCVHDGFGLVRFNEKLSGPEYARRFIEQLNDSNIEVRTLTFVTKILCFNDTFILELSGRDGMSRIETRTVVFATGCRERTSRAVGIHGRHAAGVFTAGTAQYFVNILGVLPGRKCVILGSGDVGLIMARRLILEGAEVVGVYEARPEPSGLPRNVYQCLDDFNIPLHTSCTVTRLIGDNRVSAVEIADVDTDFQPITGTERIVECDTLILSVGLIPENELVETLGVAITASGAPAVDDNCMTALPGVFVCGNAQRVYDLVDYVSDSGETAGRAAAAFAKGVSV